VPATSIPAGKPWLAEIAPATVIALLGSSESKKIVVSFGFDCAARFDALDLRLENNGGIEEFAGIVVELFTITFVPDGTVAFGTLSVEVYPCGAGGVTAIAAFDTGATVTDWLTTGDGSGEATAMLGDGRAAGGYELVPPELQAATATAARAPRTKTNEARRRIGFLHIGRRRQALRKANLPVGIWCIIPSIPFIPFGK